MIAGLAMKLIARLLLVALLVAAASTWAWIGFDRWWQSGTGETEVATQQPAEENGPETGPKTAAAPEPAAAGERPPAFDIVRVEDTGQAVIAGVAPPGWTVRVETPDGQIGEVTADSDGSWMLLPDAPLPAGDHSLSVRALAPDGSRTVDSAERVAVSVSPEREPAVVALSQANQPTRVLQSGRAEPAVAAAPSSEAPSVAFSAVDYENRDDGQDAGRLYLSGSAAPESRIAIYIDNRFFGSTTAGADGSWEFALPHVSGTGEHLLRADHIDVDSGDVLSRAEVSYDPQAVAVAQEPSVAKEPGDEMRSASANVAGSLSQEQRLSKPLDDATAVTTETGAIASGALPIEAVVVKRGDTLWHIAKKHYGSGIRYTKIFNGNRDQIRDPHWIYPGQRFKLPH